MTLFSYSSSCNPYLIQKILFELKLLSQGSIEQDHLPKNVKTIGFDKKINFSNELVKITIYDLLFTIAIYSLQNVNKHSSVMKNKHQNSLFTTRTVFPGFEPILYAGQKLGLIVKFFKTIFLVLARL